MKFPIYQYQFQLSISIINIIILFKIDNTIIHSQSISFINLYDLFARMI